MGGDVSVFVLDVAMFLFYLLRLHVRPTGLSVRSFSVVGLILYVGNPNSGSEVQLLSFLIKLG
jgi:hypothetical protein